MKYPITNDLCVLSRALDSTRRVGDGFFFALYFSYFSRFPRKTKTGTHT